MNTCPAELRNGTVCAAPVADEGDLCDECLSDFAAERHYVAINRDVWGVPADPDPAGDRT